MKLHKLIFNIISVSLIGAAMSSCEDFLDKEPPSYVLPTDYYNTEDQVQACANAFYTDILPSHGSEYGMFAADNSTDNQTGLNADSKYADGQWKTGMDNGNWTFSLIRNLNNQISTIEEKYQAGGITGSDANIRHYLGELYFFRAYQYFKMLQNWGDFPIVTEVLPDDEAVLVAACKRMPRNEVARFILKELDHAINDLLGDGMAKTRVSRDAALVLKSRVALFEGSWLTYFKGTPFVPNGEGWPGKTKDYNANYQFPTGDIDSEAAYFFGEAAKAGEEIAEKYKGKLTRNTGLLPQSESDPENPYFSMFGNTDMSSYSDVILWRQYSKALKIQNNIESAVQHGNGGVGVTRSMVEGFLMADGKPIYASQFSYHDETIAAVRENRDPRLFIFLKEPGQVNLFKNMNFAEGDKNVDIEPIPDITNGTSEFGYSTGYALRKGGSFDRTNCVNYGSVIASITFRATEAILNYIEAEYMRTKNIGSGHILEYWTLIRETAGFTGAAANPKTTIAATDINQEKLDWGAYSAGQLLGDAVLYNIRRERRCELMAEGLRWMDLIRWRALDQMITQPYHVEGIHIWNTPMESWYNFTPEDYNGSSSAKISSPTVSGEYLRRYQRNMTGDNLYRDGLKWFMAQYLQPMPIKQLQLTSPDYTTVANSSLYQNPYWPEEANLPAIK